MVIACDSNCLLTSERDALWAKQFTVCLCFWRSCMSECEPFLDSWNFHFTFVDLSCAVLALCSIRKGFYLLLLLLLPLLLFNRCALLLKSRSRNLLLLEIVVYASRSYHFWPCTDNFHCVWKPSSVSCWNLVPLYTYADIHSYTLIFNCIWDFLDKILHNW